jgi:hypothetical protein
MAIGRGMVDNEAWWTARPNANRRTAMADHSTRELGARRWRGHEAGGHANASACLRIGALLLVILTWAVLTSCPTAADVVEPNYEAQRAQMIRTIETQRELKVFHFGDNRAAGCRLRFGIPVIRSGQTFRARMTS